MSLYHSQIIYPSSYTKKDNHSAQCSQRAYLVGWNLENFKCVIAGVVEIQEEAGYDLLNEAIRYASEVHLESLPSKLDLCLSMT